MILTRIWKKLNREIYKKVVSHLKGKKAVITRSLVNLNREPLISTIEPNFYSDYIRLAALDLCVYEIQARGIEGNVAELGVYQGNFAAKINQAFPDRKLYLFDSFEGFSKQDIEFDRENKFSRADKDFSNTSISDVLKGMKYPENCIVKKGIFPETAFNMEDDFVFVSIDVDLFKPIFEGLKFFYPKLVKGGYIFVHDYNNSDWLGVRDALTRFCSENGAVYVPLPDVCGTAIITK